MPNPSTLCRLLVTAVCLGASLPVAAQNAPLSLADCVQRALAAPSAVGLAELDLDITASDRVVARSAFLPQASFSMDHVHNSPLARDPSTFSFIRSNTLREFAALVTVVQEIDTSGRVRAEYQRARASQNAAGARLAIAERELRRAVAAAYYRLLLARKLAALFADRVDDAVEFEERSRRLVERGEAARADVVKATAQTAAFRRALSASQLTADLANQELASFWTDDVSRPLNVVEVLDRPVPSPSPEIEPRAYLAREEFRLFDAEALGFDAEARRARSARLPQVQVALQWGVDRELRGLSFDDRGYVALASLQLSLFDWSRAGSQVRQADARAAQVARTREMATRAFAREYASARARVRGLYEQISLARIEATAAEEDLRLSRVRYDGGEGPALEVVTASAQLANARSGQYAAIVDYLAARRDLDAASGR